MSSGPLDEVELNQLSQALEALRTSATLPPPPDGWLQTIRRALGMRTEQLAARLGISQPSVVRAEDRERTGAISLGTLRRVANALDCDVVYVLMPRTALVDTVRARAEEIARRDSAAIAQSLGIEWQVVPPPALAEQIERRKAALVAERPARLWDKEAG
jgi:predicted DNA-binding mobile mystery protein A